MAVEIERKFLVDTRLWRPSVAGIRFRQGYLSSAKERVVRVRVAGDHAFLTVKGEATGIARDEFEYEIPAHDALHMLDKICEKPLIEKTRYRESWSGRVWEIDVFHGQNDGLVVAEVELSNADAPIDAPPWAVKEVSDDPRYFNANLIANPYAKWGRQV